MRGVVFGSRQSTQLLADWTSLQGKKLGMTSPALGGDKDEQSLLRPGLAVGSIWR